METLQDQMETLKQQLKNEAPKAEMKLDEIKESTVKVQAITTQIQVAT